MCALTPSLLPSLSTLLLALLSLSLLWRQHRLVLALLLLRTQLAQEQGERRRAEQALLASHALLCEMAARQESICEQERQRIARDVHDDLGQHLLGLKIGLAALAGRAGAPPLRRALQLLESQVQLSIESLRAILRQWQPPALEQGLGAAIARQLHEFRRNSGIACQLLGDLQAFSGDAASPCATVLYRILQESLSNILRHAHATEVSVALARQSDCLSLTVRDNGVGMPADRCSPGCGLQGMELRVRQAGGQLAIASRPGQGTALSLILPLHGALPA